MKIIFLDAFSTGLNELDINELKNLGDLEVFDRTEPDLIVERAQNAEIIIVNKIKLDDIILEQLPHLKLIVVSATGYNNIDINAAKNLGIKVANVKNYSTYSVAQQVFALLLTFTNLVDEHKDPYIWAKNPDFSYYKSPLTELANKTMGLYGIGDIGQKVAQIAEAFGMNVIATRKNLTKNSDFKIVSFEELIKEADVISLHAPLTSENFEIFNKPVFEKMKPSAILINTARGGLINENDLAWALNEKKLFAAGLDVLQTEPPKSDNVLFKARNILFSPHVAWATKEARQRLMNEVSQNIKSFLEGNPRNLI